MLLMRIIVPLLVVGLMSVSAGVAFGESHGDGGNATSTDPGLDPNATSTDPGLDPNATSSDPGLDPNATSTDPGLDPNATSTDPGLDPNATSTDPSVVEGDGDGYKRKSFPGVVHYLGNDMVTVDKNGTGEYVDIAIVEDYSIIKSPGGPNNRVELGDDARVVIHAEHVDGQWVAIWVIVKPVKPTFTPIVGTAIGTEDGVTTILLPNGKTKKIKKPKGEEDPEDGEVVTVFVEDTGDGQGEGDGEEADGEVAEATGLVKASKVAERIQSFLEKLAAKESDLPEGALNARARLVSNLAAVLERYSAQNVSIIEKLSKSQGLGAGAALGIQKALEKAQARQAKGKSIADDAKSKVGPVQNAGKGPKNIFGPSNSGGGSDENDGDGADSGGSGNPNGAGKPNDSGKPANPGSQGSNRGNKVSSGG